MKKLSIGVVALASIALAAPAFAHSGMPGHTHGFVNGLAHPLSGLDHMLAMLGVGIWSALAMKGSRVLLAPAAFVLAMLAGAGLGLSGAPLPAVETGIAFSVAVIGLLIFGRVSLPVLGAAIVIGAFGILHGYAHGVEAQGNAAAYIAGFTLATAALHLAGIGMGRSLLGLNLAARAAGGVMAAAGIGMLVL
jgi:urease accessory protein